MKSELHIELTKQCFLNCLHCSSNQTKKDLTWNQSNLEKIIKLIEYNSKEYSFIVTLTGGEPLLLENIVEIVQKLKAVKNIEAVGIFASGCLPDENRNIKPVSENLIQELKSAGLDFIYFSLYSDINKDHDLITDQQGSFKYTESSIKKFANSSIYVGVNSPISTVNVNRLNQLYIYINDLEVDELRLLRLVKHGRAKDNWEKIGLTKEKQKQALDKFLEKARVNNLRSKITAAGFPTIIDCRPFEIGRYCQAGIRHFYLNDNGQLYPCAAVKLDKAKLLLDLKNDDNNLVMKRRTQQFQLKCAQDII